MPFREEVPELVDRKVRENAVLCRAPERVDRKVRQNTVPCRSARVGSPEGRGTGAVGKLCRTAEWLGRTPFQAECQDR